MFSVVVYICSLELYNMGCDFRIVLSFTYPEDLLNCSFSKFRLDLFLKTAEFLKSKSTFSILGWNDRSRLYRNSWCWMSCIGLVGPIKKKKEKWSKMFFL